MYVCMYVGHERPYGTQRMMKKPEKSIKCDDTVDQYDMIGRRVKFCENTLHFATSIKMSLKAMCTTSISPSTSTIQLALFKNVFGF